MLDIEEALIHDVAEELNISEPSLIEKDFHVTAVLVLISKINPEFYDIVFSGGTCLSKTVKGLGRMSEDVDLKLVLNKEGMELSASALKKDLRDFKKKMSQVFIDNGYESEIICQENSNKHVEWQLQYNPILSISEALRPQIQVETTVCDSFNQYSKKDLCSLVVGVMGEEAEVKSLNCVTPTHTAAEKVVSLLRRVAGNYRHDKWGDERIVRHVYDVHILFTGNLIEESFYSIFHEVILSDGLKFKNQYIEFFENYNDECLLALDELESNFKYSDNYKKFLGPLVYKQDAERDFATALSSIQALYSQFQVMFELK